MKYIIGLLKLLITLILSILISSVCVEAAQILPALDGESKLTLQLEADEVAIFGFGSLMNVERLERPMGDPYKGPYIMTSLKGFKRTWSAHYLNRRFFENDDDDYNEPLTTVFLNVEPCEGSRVNGMLFVCSRDELRLYDYRESSYSRIRINDYLDEVRVIGGDAYVYMAKRDYFYPTEELTAWQTVIKSWYIDGIEEALEILGEDFAAEYYESTQPLPLWLVVDI